MSARQGDGEPAEKPYYATQIEWCRDGHCFRLIGTGLTVVEEGGSLFVKGPWLELRVPRVDYVHVGKL